jgi:predicted flap endonuclease-1-like 5' DNA nuclease
MFLWLLGAAILGFLLAWFLRKSSVDAAIKERDHQLGLYQSLDGEYQTAVQEKDRFAAENSRFQGERNSLNQQIQQLESERSSKDAELNIFGEKFADLETRFGELNTTYSTAQTYLDERTTAFDELQVAYNKLVQENEELKTTMERLKKSISGEQALARAATKKSNSLKADFERVFEEKQRYSTQLEHFKANQGAEAEKLRTKNTELEQQMAQMNTQLAAVAEERDELESMISEREKQREAIEADLKQVSATEQELQSNVAQVKEQNLTLANEKKQLENEVSQLKEQLTSFQSDSEQTTELQDQLANNTAKVDELEAEKAQLQAQLSELQQEMETLNSRVNQLATEKSDLAAQVGQASSSNTEDVEQLKAENSSLLAELADFRAAVEKRKSSSADNELKRQETLSRIEKLSSQVDFNRIGGGSAEDKDNLKRLRGLGGFVEKKFNALGIYKFSQIANFMKEDEVQMNEWLELPKNKIQKEDWVLESRRILGLEVDSDPVATLERVQGRQKAINFGRIGTASAANKDDLQRINDISAFDEAKLNALGIYRFSQIAAFSPKDTTTVNESIEVFDGRIDREQWVQQAQQLQSTSLEEILARVRERAGSINFTRIGTAAESAKDDLQAINGIGPFIEAKLNAVGIYQFRQIANFSAEDEATVNEVIELNTGHIQSDEWVRQAKERS